MIVRVMGASVSLAPQWIAKPPPHQLAFRSIPARHQWTRHDGNPHALQAWQTIFPVPAQVGQMRWLLRPSQAGQVTTFRPSHSGQTGFLFMGTVF
jgi:hypothetical protein